MSAPGAGRTMSSRQHTLVVGAVLAILIGAALRLPAMVQPMGIDQGIFAAAGWGMSHGGMLYRDLWDQKPPGIHLIYRAGIALFGSRETTVFWLDYIAFVASTALLGVVGSKLADRAVGLTAAACFALLGLPSIRYGSGGFLERAVPETFIVVFVLAAAVLLLGRSARAWMLWLAGVSLGCAVLLKPTALIYWPALLLALPDWRDSRDRWHAGRSLAVWTAVGLLTPILLGVAWLWSGAALWDAWVAVVEYNRAYVGVGAGPLQFADRFAHEIWRLTKTDPLWLLGMAGLAVGVVVWGIERRRDRALIAGGAWLTAALVAAAANGTRVYSTYFLPCLAPLALLAALLLGRAAPGRWRRVLVAAVVVIAAVRVYQVGIVERVVSTLTADLGQWSRAQDADARLRYLERFGSYASGRGFSARANAELSAYLVGQTPADARVFIFGMAPGVYYTAQRLPAQRFLWIGPAASGLLSRPDFTLDAVAADLERTRPAFIILERNNRDSLLGWRAEERFTVPAMQRVLGQYAPAGTIEDFVLYRRR